MNLTEKHSENFYQLTDEEKKILSSYLEILEEIFSAGINVLENFPINNVSENKLELSKRIVISILREVFEKIDGIIILIKNNSISNSKVILRSILEAYFDLNYIFDNIEERAPIYLYLKFKECIRINKKWRDEKNNINIQLDIESEEKDLAYFKKEYLNNIEPIALDTKKNENKFYSQYESLSMEIHNQNFFNNSFGENKNKVDSFRKFHDEVLLTSCSFQIALNILVMFEMKFQLNLIQEKFIKDLIQKFDELKNKISSNNKN